jgi:hypothetical protein
MGPTYAVPAPLNGPSLAPVPMSPERDELIPLGRLQPVMLLISAENPVDQSDLYLVFPTKVTGVAAKQTERQVSLCRTWELRSLSNQQDYLLLTVMVLHQMI